MSTVGRDLALALGAFDDATRQLVREMVAEDFREVTVWGPVQMAVAHVELARDGQHVEWHTERGFSSPALVRDTLRQLPAVTLVVATIAWARSRDASGALRGGDVVMPRGAADEAALIGSHWRAVLGWLPAVDRARLDRVSKAWWDSWPFRQFSPGTEAEVAAWLARVEAAAEERSR